MVIVSSHGGEIPIVETSRKPNVVAPNPKVSVFFFNYSYSTLHNVKTSLESNVTYNKEKKPGVKYF